MIKHTTREITFLASDLSIGGNLRIRGHIAGITSAMTPSPKVIYDFSIEGITQVIDSVLQDPAEVLVMIDGEGASLLPDNFIETIIIDDVIIPINSISEDFVEDQKTWTTTAQVWDLLGAANSPHTITLKGLVDLEDRTSENGLPQMIADIYREFRNDETVRLDFTKIRTELPSIALSLTNLILVFDGDVGGDKTITHGEIIAFLQDVEIQMIAGETLDSEVDIYTRCEDTLPNMGTTTWLTSYV